MMYPVQQQQPQYEQAPMSNPYGTPGQPATMKKAQGAGAQGAQQRRLYPNMNDQSFDTMQTSNQDNYYHGAA